MATGDSEDRPAEEIARGRWLELPRDSDAPFYQSRVPDFRSPQATFTEIRGRVRELLAEVPSWHAEGLYANPSHEYTRALLAAVPVPDPRRMRARRDERRQAASSPDSAGST